VDASRSVFDGPATFDNALSRLATVLAESAGVSLLLGGRFVRDIYGRLSYLTKRDPSEYRVRLQQHFKSESDRSGTFSLAPFVTSPDDAIIVLPDDDPLFDEVPRLEPILVRLPSGTSVDCEVEVLDRRVAGEEWLSEIRADHAPPTRSQRVVFFSMKGGVGRSTALAVLTADLAARGKNVLAVDLDLEAPGLGSTLLADDGMPRYGVLDWLARIAAGGDDGALLDDMVGGSTFTSGRAVVDVVPAFGQTSINAPEGYLAKLARAYVPGAAEGRFVGKSFAEKTGAMIAALEERRSYDVTLIDSRAGMHETGASTVMTLGDAVLFFGVDAAHTFEDYRFLFAALTGPLRRLVTRDRAAADAFRDNLQMISAKTTSADVTKLAAFREAAFDIFSEYIYDEEESGADFDIFRFSKDDEEAPHWSWPIYFDPGMAVFDPRRDPKVLDPNVYRRAFGTFLDNIHQKLLVR
jgi:CobQ/CobB/MinD/ParA nucleotide binding domain